MEITVHPLMLNTDQAVVLFGIANQCQLIGDISPVREYLK